MQAIHSSGRFLETKGIVGFVDVLLKRETGAKLDFGKFLS